MGSEEDAKLIRRGYEAFSSGDMATLNELFAEDSVWHVPGTGSLSGPKQGRDAILAFFGELMARSGGSLKVTLHDVVSGNEHTVGLHHECAERDNNRVDQTAVNIFHVRDGRVSEVWELHDDPASNAWLWA